MAFPSLNGNAEINCPFSDTAICILIYVCMYVMYVMYVMLCNVM